MHKASKICSHIFNKNFPRNQNYNKQNYSRNFNDRNYRNDNNYQRQNYSNFQNSNNQNSNNHNPNYRRNFNNNNNFNERNNYSHNFGRNYQNPPIPNFSQNSNKVSTDQTQEKKPIIGAFKKSGSPNKKLRFNLEVENIPSVQENSIFEDYKITDGNKYERELELDILKYGKNIFLVDTGSELSCIKRNLLKNKIDILQEEAIDIIGLNNNIIRSLGIVLGSIKLGRKIVVTQFHVLPENIPCPFEALVGMDILENCDILKSQKLLKFFKINETIPLIYPHLKIKGRTEQLLFLKKNIEDGDYLINKTELESGIFIPEALVRFVNGRSKISVLNVIDEEVESVVIKLFCSRHTEESEILLAAHPNMSK